MYKKIGKFLDTCKVYIWAITGIVCVVIFIYAIYIKVSETIPTKVYALEVAVNEEDKRIGSLEIDRKIIYTDLRNVQTELKEIKEQIIDNQKETRASLKEINRDVKDILKSI